VIDRKGILEQKFSKLGSGTGELRTPRGLALSPAGELFVADKLNDRVQVFDVEGKYLRTIGRSGSAPGHLLCPFGVAFDQLGNVLVAEQDNERISIFKPNGAFITCFTINGKPRGVCVDETGCIFVGTMPPSVQAFGFDW